MFLASAHPTTIFLKRLNHLISIDAHSTVQMQMNGLGDPMPALFDVPTITFATVSWLKWGLLLVILDDYTLKCICNLSTQLKNPPK